MAELENKKWSEQDVAASIAEADRIMGLVSSDNAQITIPGLRTRLNTGDQIFTAGVRMSALGAGLIATDSSGIVSISNKITVDPSAPSGSLAINSSGHVSIPNNLVVDTNTFFVDSVNHRIVVGDDKAHSYGLDSDFSDVFSSGNNEYQIVKGSTVDVNVAFAIDSALKTTVKQLTVDLQGVTAADGIRLLGNDVSNRIGEIYMDNFGLLVIQNVAEGQIKIPTEVKMTARLFSTDGTPISVGNGSDYSIVYSLTNTSWQLIKGSTVNTDIMIEGLSNKTIKIPTLAGTGSRAVVADVNGVLSAP